MQTIFDTKQEMQEYAKQAIDAYNKIKGEDLIFQDVNYEETDQYDDDKTYISTEYELEGIEVSGFIGGRYSAVYIPIGQINKTFAEYCMKTLL